MIGRLDDFVENICVEDCYREYRWGDYVHGPTYVYLIITVSRTADSLMVLGISRIGIYRKNSRPMYRCVDIAEKVIARDICWEMLERGRSRTELWDRR